MLKVDFHIHSYFSDGQYSPEEIVRLASKLDVTAISITDHNFSLGYSQSARGIATENGMKLIEGIEISTFNRHTDSSLHILGYSRNFNKPMLNQSLDATIRGYNKRAERIIDKLNIAFPSITFDFKEIKKQKHEAYVSRNTLAQKLVEFLGGEISVKVALKEYVFVEEDNSWMLSPEEAIAIINNAHGIAVLAHSGRYMSRIGPVAYTKDIMRLKRSGLKGIELWHPKHTNNHRAVLNRIAHANNLITTAGSDWHGHLYSPNVTVGVNLKESVVKSFMNLL